MITSNIRKIDKISVTFGASNREKEVAGYKSFSVIAADLHLPLMLKFDESDYMLMWPGDTIYFENEFKKYSYYLPAYGATIVSGSVNNYYISLGNSSYQEDYYRENNIVSSYQTVNSATTSRVFICEKANGKISSLTAGTNTTLAGLSNIEKFVFTVSSGSSPAINSPITFNFVSASDTGFLANNYSVVRTSIMEGIDNFYEFTLPEKNSIIGVSISISNGIPPNVYYSCTATGKHNTSYYERLSS